MKTPAWSPERQCCLMVLYCLLTGAVPGCQQKSPGPDGSAVANAGDHEQTSFRDDELVKQQLTKLAQAVFNGDLEALAAGTHPALIQRLGGEAAAKRALSQGIEEIKSAQFEAPATDFPSPLTYFGAQDNVVIVPTITTATSNGAKLEIQSFSIGEHVDGSWRFMDGSKLASAEEVVGKRLFPDIPSDYAFPPHSIKVYNENGELIAEE